MFFGSLFPSFFELTICAFGTALAGARPASSTKFPACWGLCPQAPGLIPVTYLNILFQQIHKIFPIYTTFLCLSKFLQIKIDPEFHAGRTVIGSTPDSNESTMSFTLGELAYIVIEYTLIILCTYYEYNLKYRY
jgi:hypothetical protein